MTEASLRLSGLSNGLVAANSEYAGPSATSATTETGKVADIFPKSGAENIRPSLGYFNDAMCSHPADNIVKHSLIHTLDVSGYVKQALADDGIEKIKASQEQLFDTAEAAASEIEYPLIEKQLAVMKVIIDRGDKPSSTAKMLKLLDKSGDYAPFAQKIADYLEAHDYDPETKTFTNDSGLRMEAQNTFCPMSQRKHLVMRSLDPVETTFAGRKVEGKFYADFLVPTDKLGQTVFPPTEDQEWLDQADYEQMFVNEPNLLSQVSLAIQRDALQTYAAEMRRDPELVMKSELDPPVFANAKPKLVVTAKPEESEQFVTRCHFPDGEWHMEIPDIVTEQMKYSKVHSNYEVTSLESMDEDRDKLRFIGVQELGTGNLLLATHLDRTFHHSTPKGGAPVGTAFEVEGHVYHDNDGKLYLKVTDFINKSGHYHPPIASMADLRDTLIRSGLDAPKTNLTALTREPKILEALEKWNASSDNPSTYPGSDRKDRFRKGIEKATDVVSSILPVRSSSGKQASESVSTQAASKPAAATAVSNDEASGKMPNSRSLPELDLLNLDM